MFLWPSTTSWYDLHTSWVLWSSSPFMNGTISSLIRSREQSLKSLFCVTHAHTTGKQGSFEEVDRVPALLSMCITAAFTPWSLLELADNCVARVQSVAECSPWQVVTEHVWSPSQVCAISLTGSSGPAWNKALHCLCVSVCRCTRRVRAS